MRGGCSSMRKSIPLFIVAALMIMPLFLHAQSPDVFALLQQIQTQINALQKQVQSLQQQVQGGAGGGGSTPQSTGFVSPASGGSKGASVPQLPQPEQVQVPESPPSTSPLPPLPIPEPPIFDDDRSDDEIFNLSNLKINFVSPSPQSGFPVIINASRPIYCTQFQNEESERGVVAPCPQGDAYHIRVQKDTILLLANRRKATFNDFIPGDRINVFGFFDRQNRTIDALIVRNLSRSVPVPPPTSSKITVTAPNGGEVWQLGSVHSVLWVPYAPDNGPTTPINPASQVNAYLERYENGSFIRLGRIIESGKASIHWVGDLDTFGNYPPPGDYYVHVINNKTGVEDRSDAPFTLVAAGTLKADLKVNGSDGPVVLAPGTTYTVSWNTDNAHRCDIHYPSDAGGLTAIFSSTSSAGDKTFTFPGAPVSGAPVSLVCTFSKIEGTASDNVLLNSSETSFVAVNFPNGGESIIWSRPYTIKWTSSADITKYSVALYKNDAFVAWITPEVPNSVANTSGNYQWTPSATLSSANVASNVFKIYIIGYKSSGGTVEDKSDAPFSIVDKPTPPPEGLINLLSPNGGEAWTRGTTQKITWFTQSPGVSAVDIDLLSWSRPCVSTIQEPCPLSQRPEFGAAIARRTLNDGAFEWSVGSVLSGSLVPGGSYVIRITNSEQQGQYDQSDAAFTIIGQTTGNNAPRISGVPAIPNSIRPGELVSFSWGATDPDNDDLVWSVLWGDGSGVGASCPSPVGQSGQGWNFTASHAWEKSGKYSVQATVSDCKGGSDARTFTVVVGGTAQASITVLSPNGGETWRKGEQRTISWQGGLGDLRDEIRLIKATDMPTPDPLTGYAYYALKRADNRIGGPNSLNWIVGDIDCPDCATAKQGIPPGQYAIRIIRYDGGVRYYDDSDAPFSIVTGVSEQIPYDSDNSPAYDVPGTLRAITPQNHPDLFVKGVAKGDYIGSSGPVLYGVEPNPTGAKQTTDPFTTYYDHCASERQLNEGYITSARKIGAIGINPPSGYVCRDGAFVASTVAERPAITLLSPNGGDTLEIGKTYNIQWKSNNGTLVRFSLLSEDGRTGYSVGTGGLPNESANDGVEPWTVSNINPGRYRLRIYCPGIDVPGQNTGNCVYRYNTFFDDSDAAFTISESVKTNLPDLTITDISADTPVIRGNRTVTWTYTVRNNSASDITAPFSVNAGGQERVIKSLGAGGIAYATSAFGLSLPGHNNVVSGRVDLHNVIQESNEANNDYSESFLVLPTYEREGTFTLAHWESVRLNNGLVLYIEGSNILGELPYRARFRVFDALDSYKEIASAATDLASQGERKTVIVGTRRAEILVNSFDVQAPGNAAWSANITASSGVPVSGPSITITGASGSASSQSALTMKVGDTLTISGVPQNLGPGFTRAFYFDPLFNNACTNNSASDSVWTLTCTAREIGTGNFYIEIYQDGQAYRSNVVRVTVEAAVQPSIVILSPNGGERWVRGNSYDIRWDARGTEKVHIDVTSSAGGLTLVSGIPASSGKYTWNIDAASTFFTPGDNYRVRVFTDPLPLSGGWIEGTNYDQSDAPFSIVLSAPPIGIADLEVSGLAISQPVVVGQEARAQAVVTNRGTAQAENIQFNIDLGFQAVSRAVPGSTCLNGIVLIPGSSCSWVGSITYSSPVTNNSIVFTTDLSNRIIEIDETNNTQRITFNILVAPQAYPGFFMELTDATNQKKDAYASSDAILLHLRRADGKTSEGYAVDVYNSQGGVIVSQVKNINVIGESQVPILNQGAGDYVVLVCPAGADCTPTGTKDRNSTLLRIVQPQVVTTTRWSADNTLEEFTKTSNLTAAFGGNAAFGSGKLGQGFLLEGSRSYVEVVDGPFFRPAGAVSVAAWVRLASAQAHAAIIKKTGSSDAGYALEMDSSGVKPCFYVYAGGAWKGICSSFALPVGPSAEFQHVAGTYDGQTVAVWVRGVSTSASASGALGYGNGSFNIGRDQVFGRYFSGTIDEVGFWQRELSENEVKALANVTTSAGGVSSALASIAEALQRISEQVKKLSR